MKKIYKPIWHYCVMTSNRGDKAIRMAIAQAIHNHLPNIPIAYFNNKYEELTEERINQLNREASCLIIGGSGLYVNKKSSSSGWYFPCKTELFDKIKVPIFLTGIGVDKTLENKNFELPKGKALNSVIKLNKLSKLSSVRDRIALSLLKKNGIEKATLTLCPAGYINVPKIKKEKQVAINFSQHNPLLGRFDGTPKYRNKNLKIFSKIINYLHSLDYKVMFIAHDVLEQSIVSDLYKLTPNFDYINTDNINIILKEYAKSQFSIGVRLHSNILSLAADTPFISIGYGYKNLEYVDLIGSNYYSTNVIDYDYNILKNLVNKIINNLPQIKQTLITNRDKYRTKSDKYFKKLTDIIK